MNMDPWQAVMTANEEQLLEILEETFSLFDIDGSGNMDFSEVEQAMESMGVTGHSDTLHVLVQVCT